MATFFGGLQLSRVFTVESEKDAPEQGMKPIYTVPSGKFSIVQLINTVYINNVSGFTECVVFQDAINTTIDFNNTNQGGRLELRLPNVENGTNNFLFFGSGEQSGFFKMPTDQINDVQTSGGTNPVYWLETAGLWTGGTVCHRWSINNGSGRTSKIRIIVFEYDLP